MTRQVALRDTKFDSIKAVIAFAATGTDDPQEGLEWATRKWGTAGAPVEITKNVSPATSSGNLDTATANLIDRELFRTVKERAFLTRMRGVRRTGFRVRSITVSNSRAVWVEEGKPLPALQPDITNTGLEPAKIGALSVWTEEALEAAPGIENLVFDDIVNAIVAGLDLALLDPANDGSAIAPASLTYGATAIASTGSIDDDLAEALSAFSGNLATAYWLTTPQIGAGLSDGFSGRDIGARGGELAGIPVLTSDAAPEGQLALVDPTHVMAAWDDVFDLGTSRHGGVEMWDSSLTQDPPTGSTLTSLWQLNLVGIRALGRVAWAAAGPSTAVSITGLFPAAS